MIPNVLPVRYLLCLRPRPAPPSGSGRPGTLDLDGHEAAFREISSWSGYAPTPLRGLTGLAQRLGVGSLWYKDEATRLGLGSFKALGGIYGVYRALEDAVGSAGPRRQATRPRGATAAPTGLRRPTALGSGLTVTCASVGNHGRAVARGAAMFGCRAVVFLPSHTPPGRVRAIRELGAVVVPVDGTYDDAVERAAREAMEHGWIVVSDTAYPGYEEIPRHIMQGYSVMARETLEQLPTGLLPTHVFLQAGVGGMAAAVTAHFREALGPICPRVVVVEPQEADCLLESALADRPTAARGSLSTSMECLACRNPSTAAWEILAEGADAFVTIPDRASEETVALLASGVDGDPQVYTQPSGAAGLAGLLAAIREPALAEALRLGRESRVLVFGSEGPPFQER